MQSLLLCVPSETRNVQEAAAVAAEDAAAAAVDEEAPPTLAAEEEAAAAAGEEEQEQIVVTRDEEDQGTVPLFQFFSAEVSCREKYTITTASIVWPFCTPKTWERNVFFCVNGR